MKKKLRRTNARSISNAALDLSRTEALLAQVLLHLMSDSSQQRKALALRNAGLSNVEIAQLMGTTAEVVGQQLYIARRDRVSGNSRKRSKRRKG
jgi:hypothetical protein